MDLTVGDLVEQLKNFPKDTEISFSGLDFYRLKMRGPKLLQFEFDQSVYRDSSGKVVVENHDL